MHIIGYLKHVFLNAKCFKLRTGKENYILEYLYLKLLVLNITSFVLIIIRVFKYNMFKNTYSY